MAVGLGATGAVAVGGAILSFLLVWFCSGSDVGAATDTGVCTGALEETLAIAGALTAAGAPFLGLLWSLRNERWKPLWIGCAVGVGVLFVLLLLVLSV